MVTLQDMAPRQVCGTRSGGGWNLITKTIGAEYASANYRVVTSNLTSHGPYPSRPLFGGMISHRGEAYVAYKQETNSSDIAFVLTDSDGAGGVTLKGGGGGASDQRATLLESQKILLDEFRDRSVYQGVDLRTGRFTYSAAPDITIGEGGFPYQLSVQRQFRPDDTHCVNCPYGWTHNWDIEVMVFSDGLEAMGSRTHQQMHTTLAALRTTYLIFKDAARDEIQRQVDAARAMAWWREKFILNVMAYRQGHAQRLYARVGQNRFEAPPGHANEFVFDEENFSYSVLEGGLDETYRRNWSFHNSKFTRHTASGEIQRFAQAPALARPFFDAPGSNGSGSNRVRVARWRIFSWRFPLNNDSFGTGAPLDISFIYWKDEPAGDEFFDNALKRISVSTTGINGVGRCLWFERDFGLQVRDTCNGSGGRSTTLAQDSLSGPSAVLTSFTSPAGYRERYEYESVGTGSRPSPFKRLVSVKPARAGSAPASEDYYALRLVYNRLGQVREVHDSMSALNCPDCAPEAQRPPVTIYSGGRAFAASIQPGVMDVRLYFDHYGRMVEQKVLVDATNPNALVWQSTRMRYDGRGRVIERTAPDGQRIQFDYNERDLPYEARRYPRPGSLEDQQGKVFTVNAEYHPYWDAITQLTDPGSRQSTGVVRNMTTYNYAPQTEWLKLTSVVLPSAFDGETGQTGMSTWSFAYDNYRRITMQTDPRGNDATFTYPALQFGNDFSRLTSVSAQRGDAWGGGVVTISFQRNAWGLVTQTDQPGPGFVNATYDNDGRKLTTGGPLNTFARRDLDQLGRTRWTHTRVTVNGVQQEQSVNTEFSRTGQATFAGRPTKNGAAPQAFSLNSFDHADRVQVVTDAEGRQMRLTYDMAGRVVREEVQNANYAFETQKTVEYEANSNNISRIVDGEGHATTYDYDGFGRLKKTTYADTIFETFEYDPNGNVTKHITRAGQTIEFWYDSRNRLTWKAQTAGQATAPYAQARTTNPTYDQLGNLISLGSMDGAGVCQAGFWYQRDGLGRIRREVQGWALGARTCAQDYKTVSYDFTDAQGNERSRPTKITWPDGFHVFYDLDDLDRVIAIRLCSSGGPGCTGVTLVSYTYDELGRRIQSRTHNNGGVLTRYRWETDNDFAAVAHDSANDAVGDVVFAAAFNRAGEPTAEDITNTAYVWPTVMTATATFGPTNALTSWTVQGQGGETLLYDANGNLKSWRNRYYIHDSENQLREVWQGDPQFGGTLTAQYEYDGFGRRVRKTTWSGGVPTHTFFLYAGDAEIGEYGVNAQNQSVLQRRYIPGPAGGETVAMIDAATQAITYLHTDGVGSVVATSNSVGTILDRYKISEWGELEAGFTGQPFRFMGARFDPETGLYYMRARYYSPELGRFIQTDPAGYAQQTNLYAYGLNSPLVFADPSGAYATEAVVGAAIIAAAVAAFIDVNLQAATHNWDYSNVDYEQTARSAASAAAVAAVTSGLFGGESSGGTKFAQLGQTDAGGITVTAPRSACLDACIAEAFVALAVIAAVYTAYTAIIKPWLENAANGDSSSSSPPPPPPPSNAGNAATPPPPSGPEDELFNSIPSSSRMSRAEFNRLSSQWGKGTFNNPAANIRHHAGTRGAGDVAGYLRRAASFNTRGASRTVLDDFSILYRRASGEFLIRDVNGRIVTYGWN
jgi:RHS repeat-associated protein